MNQPSTSVNSAQIDRLATIWAIVEARKSFPAMVVVTSATPTDDAASIARGLAQVAHDAGQRTGYLHLAAGGSVGKAGGPYAELSIAPRGSQREAFDAALATWRTMYDVVIVNAATLSSEALGAHVARIADGVVIGVCDKRRVVPADRELARLMGELRASVIGVVLTGPIAAPDTVRVSRDRSRLEVAAQQ